MRQYQATYTATDGTVTDDFFTSSDTIVRQRGTSVNLIIYRDYGLSGDTTYKASGGNIDNRENTNDYGYQQFINAVTATNPDGDVVISVIHGGSTENAILSITSVLPAEPDLVVRNVLVDGSTTSSRTFTVGDSIKVQCSVTNEGQASSGSSSLGYYIGTSSTDYSDRWGSDSVSALSPITSSPEDKYYTFVADDVGQRYFLFKADRNDDVDEDSETNNSAYLGPFSIEAAPNQPPTLNLTSPTSDVTVKPGDEVSISWNGDDPDSGALVSLGRDADNVYDNGNHSWIEYGLAEDGTYLWDTTGVPEGEYYIFGSITDTELDGYDYAGGKVIIRNEVPSIIVTEPNSGASAVVGEDIQISWDGTDSDSDATVAIGYDLDSNYGNGNETIISDGGSEDGSAIWGTNALSPGSYWLYAVISDGNNTTIVYLDESIGLLPVSVSINDFTIPESPNDVDWGEGQVETTGGWPFSNRGVSASVVAPLGYWSGGSLGLKTENYSEVQNTTALLGLGSTQAINHESYVRIPLSVPVTGIYNLDADVLCLQTAAALGLNFTGLTEGAYNIQQFLQVVDLDGGGYTQSLFFKEYDGTEDYGGYIEDGQLGIFLAVLGLGVGSETFDAISNIWEVGEGVLNSGKDPSLPLSETSLVRGRVRLEAGRQYAIELRTKTLTFAKIFSLIGYQNSAVKTEAWISNISITGDTLDSLPLNATPSDLNLIGTSIDEMLPAFSIVGRLNAVDADASDAHFFQLVNGAGDTDNDKFTIEGSALRSLVVMDYEVDSSLSVRVRATDSRGAFYEEVVTVTINDVSEHPQLLDLRINQGDEFTEVLLVTLNHNFSNGQPTEYRASESELFLQASWNPYEGIPEYQLSPDAGLKIIYLELRNADGGSVQSDAITYSPSIATPAEIAVAYNSTDIADGDATPSTADGTDFGSISEGGSTVSRIFTVTNSGGSDLSLGSVTVPTGFTVTEGLPAILESGASDTFTVRLDSTTAGTKSDDVSFTNGDSDESPFNFAIVGIVTAAPVFSLSESSASFDRTGGDRTFNVTSNHSWSWSTAFSWIASSEVANQSGSQAFTYSVERYDGIEPRVGVIELGAEVYTVSQTGKALALAVDIDADADGLKDDWENLHFGGLAHPDGSAGKDPDGDQQSNWFESIADLDPYNNSDVFFTELSMDIDGDPQLQFGPRKSTRSYMIQKRANLNVGDWTDMLEVDAIQDDGETRLVWPEPISGESCFYRVEISIDGDESVPSTTTPTPTSHWLVNEDILQDQVGANNLSQNSQTNAVTPQTIDGVIAAYFSGVGSSTGSSNSSSNPNGNYPYLYRSSLPLGSTTPITISGWMKPDPTFSHSSALYYERSTSWGRSQVYISGGNSIEYQYGDDSSTRYIRTATMPEPLANGWYHILSTRDSAGTIRLWVNNVYIGAANSQTGSSSANSLRIGGTRVGVGYFIGHIHDLRIWNNWAADESAVDAIFKSSPLTP